MAKIKVEKRVKQVERRRHVPRALVLLAVLLVLIGGVVWMLTRRASQSDQVVSQTILDASTDHPAADLVLVYPQVNHGDSRQKVEEIAGYPGDCMEKIVLSEGTQEVCVWHDGDASLVVVLLNGKVISKTKVGL